MPAKSKLSFENKERTDINEVPLKTDKALLTNHAVAVMNDFWMI